MAPIDSIEEYIQIVEKEIEKYKKFRALVTEEQNILVGGQIASLQENIRSQSILLREIRKIEEFRDSKKGKLAEELAIPENPVTLRAIANIIADERKDRLLRLLEEFRYVVRDIVRINGNNQKLAEHGKNFIEEQIEGIYEAFNKDEFYGPGNKAGKNKMKGIRLFDRKI